MAKLPSLRASDSDREHAAERLRCATAEGRLSADELEERLEVLFASRTYGELDALLADLPAGRPPPRQRLPIAGWAGAVAAIMLVLALLGKLAITRVHAAAAVAVTARGGQLRLPGPLAGPHHGLIVAGSMVGLFAVLLACAAALWVLLRPSATSDA